MKLILLASCASALVVPPLAQRRRDLPVAKGFYDEDDEHDEAPRPWEVGGVRLERLVTMTGVGAAAYTTYILGSEALDATMVKQLGISRSESVAAFGPFATLLGLVYSTILSNIYSFYLSRQELILSNLFAEAYAVRDLYELSGAIGNHSVSTTLALRAHALELRETGFRPSEDDGQRALGALVPVVADLEAAAAVEAPVPTQCLLDAVAATRTPRRSSGNTSPQPTGASRPRASRVRRASRRRFRGFSTFLLRPSRRLCSPPSYWSTWEALSSRRSCSQSSRAPSTSSRASSTTSRTRLAAAGPSTRRLTRATSWLTRSP